MVNYLSAFIFGIIQGATEFLPVSSSGHLVILHKMFPDMVSDDLAFDTILHLATLVALLWFFRSEVFKMLIAWFKSLGGKHDNDSRLAWLILIGILPALLVGYYFADVIEDIFHSIYWVTAMLIIVGILFIVFEKIYNRNNYSLDQLTWKNALAVGLAQVLAFIPGTSRSGITIIAGLANGLKREAAVKYSFLMSIPLVAAAGLSQIDVLLRGGFNKDDATIYVISFISAVVSGYLSVKYFLRFSEKYSLNIFAYYRFILAAIILAYFYF